MTDQTPTIVIVGGVAGGASAATRARRMNENANIILFEKDEYVSFANCGLPYYIGGEIQQREKLLVATPEFLQRRFNLEVRTYHEVTAIDRPRKVVRVLNRKSGETFDQPYDKLILAPGASPIVPPMQGIQAGNVFTLRNVEDTDRIKAYVATHKRMQPDVGDTKPRRVVVVGAGYIGLEMVEQLRGLGMDVALVELTPQVLPLLDAEMAAMLQESLEQHGVELHLGTGIAGLETDGEFATHVKLDGGEKLDADVVILGIGVKPNTHLAEAVGLSLGETRGIRVNDCLQTDDPDIYAVGDAVEYVYGPTRESMRVPLAGPANRAGRIAGEHAATETCHTSMAPVLGTSIVRVFDKTAGMTGLSAKAAAKFGIEARSVIVQANHHVGYYPGAQPMVIKLVYAPGDGKVLGVQVVGGEGVDKRIDVIATAMSFGGTVRDLASLDLAYAPPFGAAKDPIHMAAFAACNQLDGVVQFLAPDEDMSRYQVVDMRTDREVATGMIEGAHHIPLDQLRERIGELDKTKPTVATCASGLRSYIGSRVLMQHGFEEVYDLSGGMNMWHRVQKARNSQTQAATV